MLRAMAPALPTGVLQVELDALLEAARAAAESFGPAARRATTHGRERALLRLYGVEGLDREGRPLAATVVDRYVAADPRRLAQGVALPFALALAEYDVPIQQLALDIASGAVDLAMEAELLGDPERRAMADDALAELESAAAARIDANRTARTELVSVLGEAPRPWIGVSLSEATAVDAAFEAGDAIRDGADLVRVEVPVGSELAARLGDAGREVPRWNVPAGAAARRLSDAELAPAGSQRGIGLLREALDRVAAERGAYARLATAPAALGSAEGAAVAASERVDVIDLDPVAEIVGVGVHPERALADLSFTARLAARSGASVLLGTGPVVVGPDLSRGQSSDAATRAGRGLALQLLMASLVASEGVPPDRVAVAALPAWVLGEPDGIARAAAEVALRATLLADHPVAFVEPSGHDAPARWAAVLAAVLPPGAGLVVRRPAPGGFALAASATRAASEVAAALDRAMHASALRAASLEHARATLVAASDALADLRTDGWPALLGDAPGAGPQFGSDSVAERSDERGAHAIV